tara:strand:- start:91 stop:747 length:657 start_codon:yes stop_codon:yes gene_type:complete
MARKEKKYHFIYKTTNLLNGKYYIGVHSTNNLEDGYLGSGKRLRYSINKYGKNNHKREIIEFVDNRKELFLREEEIVNLNEVAKINCLNLRVGGSGGFVNEKHKEKFIESLKKSQPKASALGNERVKWLAENDLEWLTKWKLETSKGLKSNPVIKKGTFKGKKHSDETKKKMSESSKGKGVGKANSQYGTFWVSNGVKNKKIKKDTEIPKSWFKGRVL